MADSKGIPPAAIIGGVVLILVLVIAAYMALTPSNKAYQTYTPPAEPKPVGIGGLMGLITLFI